ncbi:MAG: PAS domain S-box protein, partial [Rhodocyclaceae bacterium]
MSRFAAPFLLRSLLPVVVITVVALGLLLAFLRHQYQVQSALHGEQHQVALETAYRAVLEATRRDVEARSRFQVMQPEVLQLVAAALDAPAEELPVLRGRLYRLLLPVYQELEAMGLQQFQFHLADGRSLLRFHLPERAGDPLLAVRPSVRIANSEQRPVHGLEVGRHAAGFRYVFPLQWQGRHLGSVELSMPFNLLQQQMNRLLEGGDYALVFDRQKVFAVVDPSSQANFSESPLHPAYVVENPQIRPAVQQFVQSPIVPVLDALLRRQAGVQQQMALHVPFSASIDDGSREYLATFLPVADLTGNPVAYVIHYVQSNFAQELRYALLWQLALGGTFILLSVAFYVGLQRQGRQLREDNRLRREAEAALARSHAELEQRVAERTAKVEMELQRNAAILGTAIDGFFSADASGRIRQANPAFCAMLGYEEAELLEMGIPDIEAAETAEETAAHIRKVLAQGHDRFDTRHRRKDGGMIDVEISVNVVTLGGAQMFYAVTRDIGPRKAAEAALRLARDEAERANLAKSEFLSRMSHELRTPLNAILGFAQMLALPGKGALDARQADDVQEILKAGRHLLAQVNEVLDLAR